MDITIRDVTDKDLDQIVAIEKASFPDPYSKLLFRILKYEVGNGFIVAEKEGILGYAISEIRNGRGHIMSMAVSPELRRAKVGEALMKETLRRLESKVKETYLEVRVGNKAAIALYEKFSFIRTGEIRRRYYPDGEDALIMARTAKGPGKGPIE